MDVKRKKKTLETTNIRKSIVAGVIFDINANMRPILIISTIVVVFSLIGHTSVPYLGVVHKLRLQEEVGRFSKSVHFYKVEIVNEGGPGGRWSRTAKHLST